MNPTERAREAATFAERAYETQDLEGTVDAWERAHDAAVEAGDDQTAAYAAVHVALHLLMDTGLLAAVRGWVRRTERLLAGADDSPVAAWLAVVRAYERFLSGDYDESRAWAARAVERGEATKTPATVTLGRICDARSHIFAGDIGRGVELLDEAAVGLYEETLDAIPLGIAYCEIVCAYQGLGLLERAEQWTAAMERWRASQGIGSLGGRCRVHRAEILRMRGALADAEREALVACEELRPYLRVEFGWPLTELGRARLAGGDVEGAEDVFREAHAIGWDAEPELATVLLAKGDVAGAASAIRYALDHPRNVPSKELPPNNRLRLVPLLECAVEVEVAAGDLDRARAAAAMLREISAAYPSDALDARAHVAAGRVAAASGDPRRAVEELERATSLWSAMGATTEAARARTALADALRAAGDEPRARLELAAAELAHATVRPGAAADSARGAPDSFVREGDVWLVAFTGRAARIRDLVGMRYIALLLANPGREMHALDLIATAGGTRRVDTGDAGSVLDSHAKEVYRRRLGDIDGDIEEARTFGDTGRVERAEMEREFLVAELTRAIGLGGRDRRANAASERARVSVTRAIRHALARIDASHEQLGDHLTATIKTGTYCLYQPDPRSPATWRL